MSQFLEQLKELSTELPHQLSREYAGRGGLIGGLIGSLELQANPVKEVIGLLTSPEMDTLISSDQVTIAMIKPRLDKYLDKSKLGIQLKGDPELTKYMIGQIKEAGLDPIIAISLQMTPEMVDEFYAGDPMNKMQKFTDPESGVTVWEEFHKLMASGPVTFIVLGKEDGNARASWRNAMGDHYDVDVVKQKYPNSLRANSNSNRNNLFHGSDKELAVFRERNFIVEHLRAIYTTLL